MLYGLSGVLIKMQTKSIPPGVTVYVLARWCEIIRLKGNLLTGGRK